MIPKSFNVLFGRAFSLPITFAAVLVSTTAFADAPQSVSGKNVSGSFTQATWNPGPAWADVLVFSDYRIQRDVISGECRLIDGRGATQAGGAFEKCRARLDQIAHESDLAPPSGKAVIVLHGLARSRDMMRPLCRHIQRNSDYLVINLDYPSTRADLGEHARNLADVIAHLEGVEEINFVAYSLGNLVVRHYLADQQASGRGADARIKRFVMIAPPNQGSELAEYSVGSQLFKIVLGDSFVQLARGLSKMANRLAIPPCEFGIIAGGRGDGKGWNPLLPADDDFTVSVASTRLPGADDFLLLPVTHTRIVFDARTQACTLRFLREGHFVSADQRHPLPDQQAASD
jgi:pimeloyl-ACP methyl ester carboxylesterase